MTDEREELPVIVMRWCLLGVSLFFVATYLFIVVSRITYPFELEWLEGLSLQHVKRVLGEGDLYVKPTIDFVPNIYPPLHPYIGAVVCSLFGSNFITLRAISFVSSLGILFLIHRFVAHETSTPVSLGNVPAAVAVGLFIATFDRVGGWLDIARIDSLYLLFVMLGFYTLRFRPAMGGFVASGLFFVAAGFVKQSGFVMAMPLMFALVYAYRHAGLYLSATIGGVAGIITILLAAAYDESWFYYYVIDMPLRHPTVMLSSGTIFWSDLVAPMPIACALALLALVPGDSGAPPHRAVILGAFLVSGLGVSWMVRSRVGTFLNDIIPAYLALSIAAGIGLERLLRGLRDRSHQRWALSAVGAGILLQFWMLRYNPLLHIPSAEDRAAGERVVEQLRALPGDIFLPHHGYLAEMAGKRAFAHTLAMDNVRLEDRGPNREYLERQIVSALAQRRFGAVILESDGWSINVIKQFYAPAYSLYLNSGVFFPREGGHLRPEFVFLPKRELEGK